MFFHGPGGMHSLSLPLVIPTLGLCHLIELLVPRLWFSLWRNASLCPLTLSCAGSNLSQVQSSHQARLPHLLQVLVELPSLADRAPEKCSRSNCHLQCRPYVDYEPVLKSPATCLLHVSDSEAVVVQRAVRRPRYGPMTISRRPGYSISHPVCVLPAVVSAYCLGSSVARMKGPSRFVQV